MLDRRSSQWRTGVADLGRRNAGLGRLGTRVRPRGFHAERVAPSDVGLSHASRHAGDRVRQFDDRRRDLNAASGKRLPSGAKAHARQDLSRSAVPAGHARTAAFGYAAAFQRVGRQRYADVLVSAVHLRAARYLTPAAYLLAISACNAASGGVTPATPPLVGGTAAVYVANVRLASVMRFSANANGSATPTVTVQG